MVMTTKYVECGRELSIVRSARSECGSHYKIVGDDLVTVGELLIKAISCFIVFVAPFVVGMPSVKQRLIRLCYGNEYE